MPNIDWFEETLNKLPPYTPKNSVFSFRVIKPFSQEGKDSIKAVDALQPLCRNCRFWKSDITWSRGDKKFCENENMKVLKLEGYGAIEVGTKEGNNQLAFPPDFGCIHFEAKDV